MMKICLTKIFTRITLTALSQRREIFSILSICYFNVSIIRKSDSMSSNSGRLYTIKHIKSIFNRMQNIFWRTNSHQISRFICWQFITDIIDNITNKFFGFSNTYSSNRYSIPCILTQKIDRFLSQIMKSSSLNNRK